MSAACGWPLRFRRPLSSAVYRVLVCLLSIFATGFCCDRGLRRRASVASARRSSDDAGATRFRFRPPRRFLPPPPRSLGFDRLLFFFVVVVVAVVFAAAAAAAAAIFHSAFLLRLSSGRTLRAESPAGPERVRTHRFQGFFQGFSIEIVAADTFSCLFSNEQDRESPRIPKHPDFDRF